MWLVIIPHLSPGQKEVDIITRDQSPICWTGSNMGASFLSRLLTWVCMAAMLIQGDLQLNVNEVLNILLLYNIGFNCLSQEEVDLVIAKGKKALGKAKPAMIRLTFHDCVGEFSRKLPLLI